MDGFGFIASLFGSVAWPAAVVIFAFIFRPQVGALIEVARRVFHSVIGQQLRPLLRPRGLSVQEPGF